MNMLLLLLLLFIVGCQVQIQNLRRQKQCKWIYVCAGLLVDVPTRTLERQTLWQ